MTASGTLRLQRGFTLMEVLIVVTMIGILAAIAIPNYSAYIQRGHRAEAKAVLLQGSHWLERFRTENNRYDQSVGNVAVVLPNSLNRSPASGTVRYNVALAVAAATYTLTAAPTGPQTGDECGSFTVNQIGQRTVVIGGTAYNAGSPQFERCWGR